MSAPPALDGASGIAIFASGDNTYAAVAAYDGVQILDVTDPSAITAASSINNTDALALNGARSIAIFASGDNTYAAVAALDDDGVQILDVTDPSAITAAGSITNTDALELDGPRGIAIFESGDHTYAAVAASDDDGVQILDISDPSSITAAGKIDDTTALKLKGASGIAIFESGGGTYAAVTAGVDDGVQIIHLAGNRAPTVDAGPDRTVTEGDGVTLSGTASDPDGDPLEYEWTQSPASPAIDFADAASPSTTFTAPQVGSDTVITLTLSASDGAATVTDSMVLTVRGIPPPAFVSSTLYDVSGVLAITFSKPIDVTPAANVVPAKMHVRESGNYTGGITLTAAELDTAADGSTISFTLTQSQLAAIAGLAVPELTIEPGAVRDRNGSPIAGTFDASTAAFVGATSISAQEATPTGMAFSSDGTRMFVVGTIGDDVNEYALSAPFDASTRTFTDATPISSQETTPTGMAFSSDGTKMFVIGGGGDDVNEYALSTAFDASTLTFVDATPISSQETAPTGMAFSSDGTRMFVVGSDGDDVNEYALSAPFDASTRTFTDATSISSQETSPRGMAFSSDGAKMFVIGLSGDDVNEYALSTAFDASTLAFTDATSIRSQETAPTGMAFSSDGAKMFVLGDTGNDVNEYALSSVYPITVTSNPPPPPTFASSTLDGASGVLAIAFSEAIDAANVVPAKIHVRESGNYAGGITLTAAELDTAADGSTISFALTPSHLAAIAGLAVPELTIEPGAVRNTAGSLITGSFDASTAAFVDATSILSQDAFPTGMAFSSDGRKMFVVGSIGDAINEYALSAAFDASTRTFTDATSISSQELSPRGMAFSSDGAKMFVIGISRNINEYALSAPFDASTLAFTDATSILSQDRFPTGMAFSSDGARMFVIGNDGDDVNEYALSTPFDASTLTFVDATSISSQETTPQGMAFSSDGAKMFVIGSNGDDVNEYALSAPFDASTRTFTDATSISSQETTPQGMAFSSDGARMFVIGDAGDDVNEYALSSVYPITVTSAVTSTPPTAEAGPDREVDEGESITLQGSGSDADGDSLTYSWSQSPATPAVSFSNRNSATPQITAPSVTAETEITLTLTVDDGTDSGTDTMVLTILDVTAENLQPTVNAGPDQTVREGAAVSMPWSASDPDGDTLTYAWSQDPDRPAIPLGSPNSSPTTFTAPQVDSEAVITFTLTVSDGIVDVSDALQVTITDSAGTPPAVNRPPTAGAGPDRNVDEGKSITLQGSGSDPDGDSLTYSWSQSPATPAVSFSNRNSATPQITAPSVTAETEITLTLTVDDGTASDTDTMVLTILDVTAENLQPTVNAGPDQTVREGASVSMPWSASDPDGDTLTYAWSQSPAVPAITFASPGSSPTTFTAPRVSSDTLFTLTLTANDGTGDGADSLHLTVRDSSSRSGGGGGVPTRSQAPALDLGALRSSGLVPIPQDVAQLLSTFDPDEPISPVNATDPPLAINGSAYMLGGSRNTLEPQTIRPGEPVSITFTVYSRTDIDHFTVYMNLQGADPKLSDSDTYIRFNRGTVSTVDPNGFIAGANVTITQDPDTAHKYRVQVDVEFAKEMGQTGMIVRMWNTRSAPASVYVINAFEVLAPAAARAAPDVPAPEPDAPPDQEPPASPAAALRMWAGFGPATIGDAGLLAALGLDYPDAVIPAWVRTGLAPLVINNGIAVDEFTAALRYVLENTGSRGATNDAAGSRPADAGPDAAAPTVASIERSDPAAETTSAQTLVFAVTFSGDVTGVDAGDFELSPDSGGGPGQFAQTSTPALAIPDDAAAVSDAITVPGPGTATSVSVSVDIAHPFTGDLMVEIVAPDGTARTLHRYSGEGTDDIVRMYAPDFGGTGIAGDWTLRVGDRAPGDAGTLNGWTLIVGHDGAGGSVTGLAGSGSQYLVTVSAPREGTYNLDVTRDSGIADAAGNPLAGAAPTGADHTYTVAADTTAPTVTSIERSSPAAASTSSRTLVFEVTFGEDVTGVDAGDFALSPDSGGGPGQFAQTSTPALAIPDNAAAVSDAITVPGPGTATSVSVSVDIAHPYIDDLTVELVAPDGTSQTLHSRSGGLANDIVRTYAPDFAGTGIAGDWTLRASDGAPGDAGTLNGWTLTIGHDGAGGSVTGLAGSGSQYLVTVSAPREGTYNLDVIRDSGIADAAGNPLADPNPTGADHTYTRTGP